MFSGLLDAIFGGLSNGSVLLLAALGLAIVFGLMGVINMAHGELMMLGAYTTVVVQNALKGTPLFDFYIFPAILAAFLVTALFGLVLERGVVRFLYGRPLETLLATWGVSLILQQFVRSVSWQFVIGIGVFCAVFFGIQLLFSKTPLSDRILQNRLLSIGALGLDALLSAAAVFVATQLTGVLGLQILLAIGVLVLLGYRGWKSLEQRNADWIGERLSRIAFIAAAALAWNISDYWGKVQTTWVRPWFGNQGQNVTAPTWLRGRWNIQIGDIQSGLPYRDAFIIVLSLAALTAVYLFLNKTDWGLRIRSVTQNRGMSACLGIPTERVDALTFALGSGLAGIAGCAVSLLGSVSANTGQTYIVDTFMVVVVGGVGKLVGSIVAALVLGVSNYIIGSGSLVTLFKPIAPISGFFEFFSTISMAKVLVFALIIVFLQIRPAGLFPQKGRTVDA